MSRYLFVLCMEKLAMLIQEKVHDGKWKPVKASKNGPAISHLFFADDYILFTQAKSSQAKLMKDVLDTFCNASSLKVNVHKTRFLASKNVPRSKINKFVSITSFHHTSNLVKYIGFPMLAGRVRNSDFSFIVDKINNRLA